MNNFLLKIKHIISNFIIFIFSFYTSLLFSPLIHLKFYNPYNLKGPSVNANYNPNNDYLRFYFIVFFTSLFFIFINYLIRNNKKFFLRLIVIFIATYSIFINLTNVYISKFSNLDMFHDGEYLGPGSAYYLFKQIPYKDIIFLHGGFWNVLFPSFSFSIFGYSIGSYLFTVSLLAIISIFTFFLLTYYLIDYSVLFFLAIFFFSGYSFNFWSLPRDLLLFLIIFFIYFLHEKKPSGKRRFIIYFIISFLSFFNFYYSVDRAFYLFFSALIYFIFLFISEAKDKFKIFLSYILGLTVANFIGIILFTFSGYKEFIYHTFFVLPKTTSLMFDNQYPYFSISSLYPYWIPIIFLTGIITFIFYNFFYLKKIKELKNTPRLFIILFLSILSLFYFKAALGRNDLPHILYASHIIFFLVFIFLDFIFKFYKKRILIFIIIFLFFPPFFSFNKLFNSLAYEPHKIKIFLNLPKISDDYWLTSEHKKVRDFILKNTTKDDYVFVFTNEAAYYYLFKRKNPTRFYTIWFAEPVFYQKEALKDLINKPPKFIIYSSSLWSNSIDEFPNSERLSLINEWIRNKYKMCINVDTVKIYCQKDSIFQEYRNILFYLFS